MVSERSLSRLHYELIRGLVERGVCPANSELARRAGVAPGEVEPLLRALSDIHGVVLHPHVCEPWIVHPFSLTPTINWVEGKWVDGEQRGWWAPCVWCALGVAAVVGGEVHIHTRYGGEAESVTIPVADGQPIGMEEIMVHFAIPPARAWDNVHQHCSLVLPFRSAHEVPGWCERYGLPQGEIVPLHQVARLARTWYGSHADVDWHKWSIAEAQDIFDQAGLTSDFWELGARTGKF